MFSDSHSICLVNLSGILPLWVAILLGLHLWEWCAVEGASKVFLGAKDGARVLLRKAILHKWFPQPASDVVWGICRRADVTGMWALLGLHSEDGVSDILHQHPFTGDTFLHCTVEASGDLRGQSLIAGSSYGLMVSFLVAQPRGRLSVSKQNHRGRTPLHLCSRLGLHEIAARLLSCATPNLEVKDNYQSTALVDAVREEHPKMVQTLLRLRADTNVFVPNCHAHGETPLVLAVKLRNADIVELLIRAPGINIHQKTMEGTPDGLEAADFLPSKPGRLRTLLLEAIAAHGTMDRAASPRAALSDEVVQRSAQLPMAFRTAAHIENGHSTTRKVALAPKALVYVQTALKQFSCWA